MRIQKVLLILSLFLFTFAGFSAPLEGQWKTVDDKTNKPKSIVSIFKSEGKYRGKITKIIESKEADPKCTECKGDKKDKPILGLEILWGLSEKKPGKVWSGGKVLDPKSGKIYKCKLKIDNDKPDELTVRGYLGISLIGRSQTWYRVKP